MALCLDIGGCNPVKNSNLPLDPLTGIPSAHDLAVAEPTLSFYDPADNSAGTASYLPFSDLSSDPPPGDAKPLPWAIPESVYFIYRSHQPNEQPNAPSPRRQPVATAFVLSVPGRKHTRYTRFLVTARHVVDPLWAHCSDQNPISIDLRLNRRSGGVGYEVVPLQSGTVRRFYTPSDSSTDLAVIPLDQDLIPRLEEYKFIDVPFHLLPTESELRLIHPEQQVMTARLSSRPSNDLGNYPVYDAGSLSKMPAEAVGVRCGLAQSPQLPATFLHVWFINTGVPQGVSGAPVYIFINRGPGAARTPVLLGIQSVVWPDKGIAGITPSPALGDLIESALDRSKLNLDFYRGPSPSP